MIIKGHNHNEKVIDLLNRTNSNDGVSKTFSLEINNELFYISQGDQHDTVYVSKAMINSLEVAITINNQTTLNNLYQQYLAKVNNQSTGINQNNIETDDFNNNIVNNNNNNLIYDNVNINNNNNDNNVNSNNIDNNNTDLQLVNTNNDIDTVNIFSSDDNNFYGFGNDGSGNYHGENYNEGQINNANNSSNTNNLELLTENNTYDFGNNFVETGGSEYGSSGMTRYHLTITGQRGVVEMNFDDKMQLYQLTNQYGSQDFPLEITVNNEHIITIPTIDAKQITVGVKHYSIALQNDPNLTIGNIIDKFINSRSAAQSDQIISTSNFDQENNQETDNFNNIIVNNDYANPDFVNDKIEQHGKELADKVFTFLNNHVHSIQPSQQMFQEIPIKTTSHGILKYKVTITKDQLKNVTIQIHGRNSSEDWNNIGRNTCYANMVNRIANDKLTKAIGGNATIEPSDVVHLQYSTAMQDDWFNELEQAISASTSIQHPFQVTQGAKIYKAAKMEDIIAKVNNEELRAYLKCMDAIGYHTFVVWQAPQTDFMRFDGYNDGKFADFFDVIGYDINRLSQPITETVVETTPETTFEEQNNANVYFQPPVNIVQSVVPQVVQVVPNTYQGTNQTEIDDRRYANNVHEEENEGPTLHYHEVPRMTEYDVPGPQLMVPPHEYGEEVEEQTETRLPEIPTGQVVDTGQQQDEQHTETAEEYPVVVRQNQRTNDNGGGVFGGRGGPVNNYYNNVRLGDRAGTDTQGQQPTATAQTTTTGQQPAPVPAQTMNTTPQQTPAQNREIGHPVIILGDQSGRTNNPNTRDTPYETTETNEITVPYPVNATNPAQTNTPTTAPTTAPAPASVTTPEMTTAAPAVQTPPKIDAKEIVDQMDVLVKQNGENQAQALKEIVDDIKIDISKTPQAEKQIELLEKLIVEVGKIKEQQPDTIVIDDDILENEVTDIKVQLDKLKEKNIVIDDDTVMEEPKKVEEIKDNLTKEDISIDLKQLEDMNKRLASIEEKLNGVKKEEDVIPVIIDANKEIQDLKMEHNDIIKVSPDYQELTDKISTIIEAKLENLKPQTVVEEKTQDVKEEEPVVIVDQPNIVVDQPDLSPIIKAVDELKGLITKVEDNINLQIEQQREAQPKNIDIPNIDINVNNNIIVADEEKEEEVVKEDDQDVIIDEKEETIVNKPIEKEENKVVITNEYEEIQPKKEEEKVVVKVDPDVIINEKEEIIVDKPIEKEDNEAVITNEYEEIQPEKEEQIKVVNEYEKMEPKEDNVRVTNEYEPIEPREQTKIVQEYEANRAPVIAQGPIPMQGFMAAPTMPMMMPPVFMPPPMPMPMPAPQQQAPIIITQNQGDEEEEGNSFWSNFWKILLILLLIASLVGLGFLLWKNMEKTNEQNKNNNSKPDQKPDPDKKPDPKPEKAEEMTIKPDKPVDQGPIKTDEGQVAQPVCEDGKNLQLNVNSDKVSLGADAGALTSDAKNAINLENAGTHNKLIAADGTTIDTRRIEITGNQISARDWNGKLTDAKTYTGTIENGQAVINGKTYTIANESGQAYSSGAIDVASQTSYTRNSDQTLSTNFGTLKQDLQINKNNTFTLNTNTENGTAISSNTVDDISNNATMQDILKNKLNDSNLTKGEYNRIMDALDNGKLDDSYFQTINNGKTDLSLSNSNAVGNSAGV